MSKICSNELVVYLVLIELIQWKLIFKNKSEGKQKHLRERKKAIQSHSSCKCIIYEQQKAKSKHRGIINLNEESRTHSHQKQAIINVNYILDSYRVFKTRMHTTIHMCNGYVHVLYRFQLMVTMILPSKTVKEEIK